eukprot:355658-Chlamydomonas_euryale.AAC.8
MQWWDKCREMLAAARMGSLGLCRPAAPPRSTSQTTMHTRRRTAPQGGASSAAAARSSPWPCPSGWAARPTPATGGPIPNTALSPGCRRCLGLRLSAPNRLARRIPRPRRPAAA